MHRRCYYVSVTPLRLRIDSLHSITTEYESCTMRSHIASAIIGSLNATKNITRFQVDISDILDACKDEKTREPLQNLATKFKYSDPVSIEETKEIESEITKELKALKTSVSGKNTEATLVQIEKIVNLLNSRNRICGSYK